MIDVRTVMTQVKQGQYPSQWCVYYGLYNPGCLNFFAQAESCYIVIHPHGLVKWDEYNPHEPFYIYFYGVHRIELSQKTEISGFDGDISSRTFYWLDVYGLDGTYYKMPIENYFGDAAAIGKTIIAAYDFYRRNGATLP